MTQSPFPPGGGRVDLVEGHELLERVAVRIEADVADDGVEPALRVNGVGADRLAQPIGARPGRGDRPEAVEDDLRARVRGRRIFVGIGAEAGAIARHEVGLRGRERGVREVRAGGGRAGRLDEGALVGPGPILDAVPAHERDRAMTAGHHRLPDVGGACLGESAEEHRSRSAARARQRIEHGSRIVALVQRLADDGATELRVCGGEVVRDLPALVGVVDDERRLRAEVRVDERGEGRALDVVRRRRPDVVDAGRECRPEIEGAVAGLRQAGSRCSRDCTRGVRPGSLSGSPRSRRGDDRGPTIATTLGSATIAVTLAAPRTGS